MTYIWSSYLLYKMFWQCCSFWTPFQLHHLSGERCSKWLFFLVDLIILASSKFLLAISSGNQSNCGFMFHSVQSCVRVHFDWLILTDSRFLSCTLFTLDFSYIIFVLLFFFSEDFSRVSIVYGIFLNCSLVRVCIGVRVCIVSVFYLIAVVSSI